MAMIRDTLEDLSRSLRVSPRRRRAIERELKTHLEEAQLDLETAGWSREEAAVESVRRLGDPNELAIEFSRVYRPSRRRRIGLAVCLSSVLCLGAYGASGTLASATATHRTPTVTATHHQHHRTVRSHAYGRSPAKRQVSR
jgi:hypothetical protein